MERVSDSITRADAVKILRVCWDQHIVDINYCHIISETGDRIADSTCFW